MTHITAWLDDGTEVTGHVEVAYGRGYGTVLDIAVVSGPDTPEAIAALDDAWRARWDEK